MAEKSRLQSAGAADIGELPKVKNRKRRNACRLDLHRFLTTYFPASTGLSPFSGDHVRVIGRIQRCVLEGGRYANVVYRGFAKTSIAEGTAIWATIYGHRSFVPIFGADADSASGIIESVKHELSENDLLLADFPEVCFPFHALEGKPQRALSQTYRGERTHIEFTALQVVLPTIPKSAASGAVLCARGITAGFRGLKHKRPDGAQARPDFVILDDPQTDESAATPHQVNKTLNTLRKAILKLGSHRRQLAIVCNATVIEPDDAVDHLLRDPSWQGERIPMVRQWPEAHQSLWLGKYADLRRTFDRDIEGDQQRAHAAATEFYRQNREAMDKGAVVSWENCFDAEAELSAIQHAYNALIDDGEEAFASEYQNQPLPKTEAVKLDLQPAEIAKRTNDHERGLVPTRATKLTAMIDVQQSVMFWMVAAWEEGFGGAIVDYGAWPDQQRAYFTLRDLRRTIQQETGLGGLEESIYAALGACTAAIVGREWKRDGGGMARIDRCLVDANWGSSTDTVYRFCRQSGFAGVVMPSHGKFFGAATRPMGEWTRKPGDRCGLNWRVPVPSGRREVRHVLFDANFWKSHIFARLMTPMGGKGVLTLFGNRDEDHRLLADHLTAEYRVRTQGRGREVDEWKIRPERNDNHWLDCLAGCAVAASMEGIGLNIGGDVAEPTRRRMSFAEMQQRNRDRKGTR